MYMLVLFIIVIAIAIGVNVWLQNKRIKSGTPLISKTGFTAWSILAAILFFISLLFGMDGSILFMLVGFCYTALITQYGLSVKWSLIKSSLLGFLGLFPCVAIIPFLVVVCSSNSQDSTGNKSKFTNEEKEAFRDLLEYSSKGDATNGK